MRQLGAELDSHVLEAWIRPLVARLAEGESGPLLTLCCPTAFHCRRVRERFLERIERCAAAELGRALEVKLVVTAREAESHEERGREVCAGGADESVALAEPKRTPLRAIPGRAGRRGRTPAPAAATEELQDELPYRFDNFVVGGANALAREAALAVARSAQRALNPLVLAADGGLGKTHLARAIVAEARRRGERRILYTSAERFTSEFTASLVAKRAEHFKRRYREGCRLLVLEDLQFFDERKKATQTELFHTLCHLIDVGARVVITADKLPRDLEGLSPRLRAQLTSGVVAELETPDAALRREILRRKAADGGVRLPEECRELLVESVRGSVRDLLGVLTQLVATASLLKRPIDTELTLRALRKLAPIERAQARLAVADVLAAVSAYFKKRPDELARRSKRRDVLVPRQLAMYLCRRYTDAPLSEIGAALGREHSSVSNAVRAVEQAMLARAPLRYQVEALCARLDGMLREGGEPGPGR